MKSVKDDVRDFNECALLDTVSDRIYWKVIHRIIKKVSNRLTNEMRNGEWA